MEAHGLDGSYECRCGLPPLARGAGREQAIAGALNVMLAAGRLPTAPMEETKSSSDAAEIIHLAVAEMPPGSGRWRMAQEPTKSFLTRDSTSADDDNRTPSAAWEIS